MTEDFAARFRREMEQAEKTPEFQLERLILEFTEKMQERMDELNMSRAELAEKLGVSRPRVTNILKGYHSNFNLKTMVDVAHALGLKFQFAFTEEPKTSKTKVMNILNHKTHRKSAKKPDRVNSGLTKRIAK